MTSEVGSAYFTLLPTVKGLQGSLAKEVAGLDGTAAGATVGKSVGGGMVGSIKSLVGPALATLGVGAVANFAKNAVNSFSELEDSSAAAAVTFSGNMDRITDLSKTASGTLGLSSQQVVNSAQMFGVFGKSAGLAGEDLESFALDMTNLSGDLSSFSGKSTEDAITAVGAAMRGEFEPIRSFGVLLDDATLRQEALALGLTKTTKEALTPQQKTLAAQSAILKQTKDAQGDFNRTSQSTANVAKTLAAESENVSAKLGSLLAPAFTAVRLKALEGVRGLSGFLDTAQTVMPRVGAAWTGLKELFKTGDFTGGLGQALGIEEDSPVVGFLLTVRETAVGLFDSLKASIGPLVPQVFGLWQQFSPLSLIFQALQPLLPTIVNLFSQVATVVGPVLGQALNLLTPILGQLVDLFLANLVAALPALNAMVVTFTGALGQVAPVVAGVLAAVLPLVGALIGQLAPVFTSLVQSVLPPLVSVFGSVVNAIAPLVTQIAQVLVPVIQALLPVVVTVFSVVASVITSALQVVQGVVQVVTGLISGNWSAVWQGMANVLQGVWNLVVSVVRGALQIVGSVVVAGVQLAVSFFQNAFNGLVGFLGGVFGSIGGAVSTGVGNVVNFFTSLPGKIVAALAGLGGQLATVGSQMMEGFIGGVTGMAGRIFDSAVNAVKGAVDGVKKFLGIASPSRLLRQLGRFTGQGYTLGVVDETKASQEALKRLVTPPPPPTAELAAAGGRYAYDVETGTYRSGPLVEQKVYPSEKMSEQNLADVAAGKIVEELV